MNLKAAREAVRTVVDQILATPDAALVEPFDWHGTGLTRRQGIFHLLQEFEGDSARFAPRTEVGALAAHLGDARGDFLGALLPFADLDLDLVPAPGEWTLRQTLGHVADALAWWTWLLTYWGSHPDLGWPPREEIPQRFREEGTHAGSLGEIGSQIETDSDSFSGLLVPLAGSLGARVRWNKSEVPLRFYPLRATQHFREHAIQVDKTLAMLGRQPTEQERIGRILMAAAGRLEGAYLTGEADWSEVRLEEILVESRVLFGGQPSN